MFNSFVSNLPGDARPGSLGRPVAGFEVEVDGSPPEPGSRGPLRVRGRSRAIAMDGEPLAANGWCETGDEVAVDGDGRLLFRGRSDDRFKVRGQFVRPAEIERRIREVEGVRDCLVVPEIGERGLVVVAARIVPSRPGSDATLAALGARIVAYARRALESFEAPERIVFVSELPRTERGKVVRRAAAEPWVVVD
jgi:acyl-coenzyme A synthetase/AMP-(fatty) acid ligase